MRTTVSCTLLVAIRVIATMVKLLATAGNHRVVSATLAAALTTAAATVHHVVVWTRTRASIVEHLRVVFGATAANRVSRPM